MLSRHSLILFSLLLILSAYVFLPGISGPWIFDDYTDLVHNSYIRIQTLDADALYHSAYSLETGPLKRPISMVSFALNHYFSGGINNTAPYKITNIIIHIINGLLIFWLLRIIFARLTQIAGSDTSSWNMETSFTTLLAGAAAMLWLIHPIQITSVLYIVQRMTEIAALFTLFGLISYIKGRLRLMQGNKDGLWLIFAGPVLFGCLGIFSKENAALLPVFMAVLEFTLFADEWPWRRGPSLSVHARRALMVVAIISVTLLFLWAIHYASPGYRSRDFTMPERLMTEARVLFFYLSVIFIPQINRFGHQHDDIAISTSLFTPWTTLPAILGLVALMIAALLVRKKFQLLTLGILWFFAGHLMESTIFPLEIAHEHRNYIPSLGIILVMVHLIAHVAHQLNQRKLWVTFPLLLLFMGGTTYVRAEQWSNHNSFYRYEALHHPNSPRTQSGLSILLEAQGYYAAAMVASRRAAELEPNDDGYMLDVNLLAARQGITLGEAEQQETLKRLALSPITVTTINMLDRVGTCLQTWCKSLQVPMETWIKTLLKRTDTIDRSFFYYQMGRTMATTGRMTEAIEYFRQSHQKDTNFLHPLFELANIYIHLGKVEDAEQVLSQLQKANEKTPHPRDREIKELASAIDQMKKIEERPLGEHSAAQGHIRHESTTSRN